MATQSAEIIGAENARLFMRAIAVGKGESEPIRCHRRDSEGHVRRLPMLSELEGDTFDIFGDTSEGAES